MTKLTKPRFALYLALIFLAGGITGAVGWKSLTPAPSSLRHAVTKAPTMQEVMNLRCRKLQTKLGLTAEQVEKINPILNRAAQEMDDAHRQTMSNVCDILKQSNAEIAEVLTPEQRAKLEEMEKDWPPIGKSKH